MYLGACSSVREVYVWIFYGTFENAKYVNCSVKFGDPSSFIWYICDFIFRIGIISVIKLYSSIFDTFNYLNYVREKVTDKADHAVKGTYSVFFLEHLNHVIKRS